MSGGGCLSIGTDGDVGETCALFSLPGPTFPGSMLWAFPGAFGGMSLADGSARMGELVKIAAAIAAPARILVLMRK